MIRYRGYIFRGDEQGAYSAHVGEDGYIWIEDETGTHHLNEDRHFGLEPGIGNVRDILLTYGLSVDLIETDCGDEDEPPQIIKTDYKEAYHRTVACVYRTYLEKQQALLEKQKALLKIGGLEAEVSDAKVHSAFAEAAARRIHDMYDDLSKDAESYKQEALKKLADLEKECKDLRITVLELKAKLYDIMTQKGGDE